jgi:hypothetical protein
VADPFTLGAIGAVALTEGIKFFYGQASEVLKHWRERRKEVRTDEELSAATETLPVTLPGVFDGDVSEITIHYSVVKDAEPELLRLHSTLARYAEGLVEVDAGDHELLAAADDLRRVLEGIYGSRLTLKGENRPPSGTPVVVGRVVVEELEGVGTEATGVEADEIEGDVVGEVEATKATAGAKLFGVRAGRIRGRRGPSPSKDDPDS